MSDAPGPNEAGPQTRIPEPTGPEPSPAGPVQAGSSRTEPPRTEPPRSDFPRPALPPTAPERGGRRALLLGVGGVLMSLPLGLVGLVLSLAAVVTGIRARQRARRVLAPVPGATPGIVLGAIGLVLCAFSLTINALVWNQMRGYEECRQSALTIDDHHVCQDRYFPQIERRLHMPPGSLNKHRSWF